jgi:hypothetical protein
MHLRNYSFPKAVIASMILLVLIMVSENIST